MNFLSSKVTGFTDQNLSLIFSDRYNLLKNPFSLTESARNRYVDYSEKILSSYRDLDSLEKLLVLYQSLFEISELKRTFFEKTNIKKFNTAQNLNIVFNRDSTYSSRFRQQHAPGIINPEIFLAPKFKGQLKDANCLEISALLLNLLRINGYEAYLCVYDSSSHANVIVKVGKEFYKLKSTDEGNFVFKVNKTENFCTADDEGLLFWNVWDAKIYAIQGQSDLADSIYTNILTIKPDYYFALVNKIHTYRKLGNLAEALALTNECIFKFPNNYNYRSEKKEMYMDIHQLLYALSYAEIDVNTENYLKRESQKVIDFCWTEIKNKLYISEYREEAFNILRKLLKINIAPEVNNKIREIII